MLETQRLLLREYTPDDFDALYEIMSDPETMQNGAFAGISCRGYMFWLPKNYV